MADLLVCGDIVLTSAQAPPLLHGAVLICDGAVAAVGDRDSLRSAAPGRRRSRRRGHARPAGSDQRPPPRHGDLVGAARLPRSRPAGARAARHGIRVVDGHDARARCRRPLSQRALQERAADRVGHHVAPAHALPVGRRRRPAARRPTPRSCRRRCAPTATRASASPWRRTGATARAWPTTATRRSSRACRPSCSPGRAVRPALVCPPRPTSRPSRDLVRGLDGDPLLSAQFSIMAPQWASDELVRAVGSAAAELDAGIHLHALESRLQRAWGDGFANAGELQRLVEAQVLTNRSALAHGVWLRDADIELLARSGATVVHNCASNLRLAAGIAPLRQLVAVRRRRRARARRHGHRRRRRHARGGAPRARPAARARRGRASAPAERPRCSA